MVKLGGFKRSRNEGKGKGGGEGGGGAGGMVYLLFTSTSCC